MDRVEAENEKNVNEDYVLNKIGGDGIVSAYFILYFLYKTWMECFSNNWNNNVF